MSESDSTHTDTDNGSGRKKLTILFAIAFVPIFVAYGVFFFFPTLMPSGTTNNGVLISPPINTGTTAEQWTLLVAVGVECDDVCQRVLIDTRQIHIALGKEAPRVHRKIVVAVEPESLFAQDIEQNHQHTELVVDPVLMSILAGIVATPNTVFLMDPLGNIMMYFPSDRVGKPLLKDVKHLLKISNIG